MVAVDDGERLLASAGEDGAISIWNARSVDAKPKCSMTMPSAVVALSFTPDGVFIAGCTNEHVFIWKSDDVHLPRATWTRGDEVGWRTPQSHDSSTDEDQFSLCWDAHGQKLAYGVNSRVCVVLFYLVAEANRKKLAVINFRR
jgi:transducin (beta)-like 1